MDDGLVLCYKGVPYTTIDWQIKAWESPFCYIIWGGIPQVTIYRHGRACPLCPKVKRVQNFWEISFLTGLQSTVQRFPNWAHTMKSGYNNKIFYTEKSSVWLKTLNWNLCVFKPILWCILCFSNPCCSVFDKSVYYLSQAKNAQKCFWGLFTENK